MENITCYPEKGFMARAKKARKFHFLKKSLKNGARKKAEVDHISLLFISKRKD